MKVVRYIGNGKVSVVEERVPPCPDGGLLVQTEACGLCSGELMAWYMDQKVPHILGHEVSGVVVESQTSSFPVGMHVFPHHHAPCLHCEECRHGRFVHCPQWRATKLIPGGMAEYFAVARENLSDTIVTDGLRPIDAALIEPLACVVKSLGLAGSMVPDTRIAIVGLGVMGLLHALLTPGSIGYDLQSPRVEWARGLGIDARRPENASPADLIFVCPGSQAAFDFACRIAGPAARIVMFAPLPPGECLSVPQTAYFRDLAIRHSYSCGPTDTQKAALIIREGKVRAEQVVSDFVDIDALPDAYQKMKAAEILKAMVVFT